MAWTAPPTFSDGSVLTAAQLNAALRDNLNETAPGKASASNQIFVSTAANTIAARTGTGHDGYVGGGTDTTNSTSYTALSGGAAVAITTGTKATVFSSARVSHDTVGARAYVSHAVSGATTIAADDNWGIVKDADGANRITTMTYVTVHSTLTAGANTFTQQFKVGANIMSVANRRLTVIPF